MGVIVKSHEKWWKGVTFLGKGFDFSLKYVSVVGKIKRKMCKNWKIHAKQSLKNVYACEYM